MSLTQVIRNLEKLLKEHQELHTLSLKKVDVIKTGDINALNSIMKEEQSFVARITMLENERQKEIQRLYPEQPNMTLADLIQVASGTEKQRLEELHRELATVLNQLKEQNELNQQLIFNSLQFVNFSLNLFRPKNESYTYGPPVKKQQPSKDSSSVFNSQA